MINKISIWALFFIALLAFSCQKPIKTSVSSFTEQHDSLYFYAEDSALLKEISEIVPDPNKFNDGCISSEQERANDIYIIYSLIKIQQKQDSIYHYLKSNPHYLINAFKN